MKKIILFGLLLNIILISCNPMKQADYIVTNAKVYTVDSAFSQADAFAVKDGKFIAVGTREDILKEYTSDNMLDFKGKPVYPGFIDGHCHFYYYGINLRYANLVGTKSFDEVMQRLEAHHQAHPSEWILGRGWDQNDWDIKTFPDKELLDKQYPEIPVLLTRIDGHAVLVNSEAMHRAAITEDSDIPAGEAIKNQHGFTGVFLENTADKLRAVVPVPDREQQERALIEAQENCFSVGLTSVTDAGLEKPVVDLIDSLQQQGKLKMQMDVMLLPDKENIESFVKKGPYKTNRLHIHAIKLFADGALGSRGACLIAPYADDPANYGMIVQPKSHYRELFRLAYKYNYQVNTHAIGDSAVRFLLKEYGEVLQEKNDRRWRIEHSQVVHPDDMHLYGEYNIIPSVQTTHATSDMYWADERLGTERIKTAYAYRELLEQNGWLINGTDFPIEDIDPLKTFYAGVFRKDAKGYPAEGFQMENALTRQQTLKSMTIWAAKGSFEENEKGSIEVGKKADFVVLNQDIMEVGEKAILETKVVSTYLNGEAVYQNDTFLQ